MKKHFHFNSIIRQIVVIATLPNICIVSGQTEKKQQFPIPENINKIFQSSCMPCHGKEGGRFPKSTLNFSRWSGYDAAKQAEKASSICNTIRKGTMPPKSTRESKPELIPTKEQIDLICNWSEELKLKEKKTRK
jgi:hypothetical protein